MTELKTFQGVLNNTSEFYNPFQQGNPAAMAEKLNEAAMTLDDSFGKAVYFLLAFVTIALMFNPIKQYLIKKLDPGYHYLLAIFEYVMLMAIFGVSIAMYIILKKRFVVYG